MSPTEQKTEEPKLKRRRKHLYFISAILILIFCYDAFNYVRLPPVLRVAYAEAFLHPYADKINVDAEFSKIAPIGSDKSFVLDLLADSNFKISELNFSSLSVDDKVRSNEGSEFYWASQYMPASLVKKLLLFGRYRIHCLVEFRQNKLIKVRMSVLLETL